ncbi:Neprilysin-11 [Blattella germanica]|nr:Neprilysin-11 [Blattella germanica]
MIVNGETTLGENIADNGGVRETYRAYQKYVAANGPEPGLPGLEEFSSEQLLFLSFANMWCVDEGSTYFLRIFFDEHSPAQFRVLGSLSNSPEFSETWKCPANSTMNNAQNRCTLW